MKKIFLLFSVFLLVLSLVACKQSSEVDGVIIEAGESSKFDTGEVNKAINTVKNGFDLKGCTLKKVWYDEERSDYTISGYTGSGKGSVNGVKPENIIVVFMEFDVDSAGGDGSFQPDSTYSDWEFTLIRDDKKYDWKVDTMGY